MDLISLGHAGWLIEAAGLRILCDPLLEREHYNGVFEVSPPRRVRADRLRPDFIVVSHSHPDHFDVASLAALARLDPESVVITADPLVAETARALGFVTVHELGAGQRVELDGVQLVTTESLAPNEWGVMIASEHGVVWNQIDSVFASPEQVRAVRDQALAALGRERLDVALVMGRPMLEIAAQLGLAIGFPYDEYAKLLAELVAIDPVAIVPASADTAHVGQFAWMNQVVYPVDVARFVRDAQRVCPSARVFTPTLGGRHRLRDGVLEFDASGGLDLIDPLAEPADRGYRPFAIPPLEPTPTSRDPSELRAELDAWISTTLRDGLVTAWPSFGVTTTLRFVVEAVFPGQRAGAGEAWTLDVGRTGASVRLGADPGWDLYNLVDAVMFAEILAGRRAWGEALLAGSLRAASRAYELDPSGLERANVGEVFLYYALSYDESFRRATQWQRERSASD